MKNVLKGSSLLFASALALNVGLVGCASDKDQAQDQAATNNAAGYVPAQTPSISDQESVAFQTATTTAPDTQATQTAVTPAPDLGAASSGRAQ